MVEKADWSGAWLPIGPFRAWLERELAAHGTIAAVAELIERPPRRIYHWRHKAKFVPLNIVDRVMECACGDTWRHLYDESDIIDRSTIHVRRG